MAFGIPLELFTMLGSTALAGVMSIWSRSIESREKQHTMAIEGLTLRGRLVKEAREYENKGFQWTRRILALMAVSAIIVWPMVVPVFWPDVSVTVGFTEWRPGFLFIEGREVVKWRAIEGLAVTPLHTHFMMAIVGLFFGQHTTKIMR